MIWISTSCLSDPNDYGTVLHSNYRRAGGVIPVAIKLLENESGDVCIATLFGKRRYSVLRSPRLTRSVPLLKSHH